MATSVTTSLPTWLAGCTYDANGGTDLRNSTVTALLYDPGIYGGTIGLLGGVLGGLGLQVTAGTGLRVNVQPGSFAVPASATPTAGGYTSTLASSTALVVQTADPTNPRIDIIVAYVSDAGSASSFGAIEIITGTAAPSPSAPSAPANSIVLAQLRLPATATSVNSSMITDMRPFTAAVGGVLKSPKGAVQGYHGQIGYDVATDRFYHNLPSGYEQLGVLPWAPVSAYKTTDTVSVAGAVVTVGTVTISTDGSTDIAAYVKGTGIYMSASHGEFGGNLQILIDSVLVDQIAVFNSASDGVVRGGAAFTYYTDSSQGSTLAAGTHTVTFQFQGFDAGSLNVTLRAAAYNPAVLRVSPVVL